MKFEKQTYTQTPNSLFTMMKDMDECELKVVLLICRYTFGYHREEVKLSTRRIAEEIGMNTVSVQKGADQAVGRGLIEKLIDGNKTTTWRAVVGVSESESQVYQNLNRGVSDSESLLGIKENLNKVKKGDIFDGIAQYEIHPKEIRDSIALYFRLTPNWEAKYNRQFMEWAVESKVVEGQVKKAADLWRSDKRFNWQVPTLKGIQEHWLELIATESNGMNPQGLTIS